MNHFAREELTPATWWFTQWPASATVRGGVLSAQVLVHQTPAPGRLLLPLSTASSGRDKPFYGSGARKVSQPYSTSQTLWYIPLCFNMHYMLIMAYMLPPLLDNDLNWWIQYPHYHQPTCSRINIILNQTSNHQFWLKKENEQGKRNLPTF